MDKEYIKQLIDLGYKNWEECPEDDIVWSDIMHKIFNELAKSLEETVDFIDECDEKELHYLSQILEELSEHFKSQKLIECVERNITRFPDEGLQKQLQMELEYMKLYV